jgi:hypothetical protein
MMVIKLYFLVALILSNFLCEIRTVNPRVKEVNVFKPNLNIQMDSVNIEYWKIDKTNRYFYNYNSRDSTINIKSFYGNFSKVVKGNFDLIKFQNFIQMIFLTDKPYIISKDISPVSDYSRMKLKIYLKNKSVSNIKIDLEVNTVFTKDFNDFKFFLDSLIIE